MTAMWKDEAARARMREWHARFREHIQAPLESRVVPTSFGETHVLVGGPVDAPPVVVLHGALATSAHVLAEFQGLFEHHRVYGVDVLGQSAMSADVRLPVHDDSAGRWLREVVDALGLQKTALIGVSWGGFVAQRFAAVAPKRLTSLILLVPAGMVATPRWRGFVDMGWPMTRYLLSPSAASRDSLLKALLTTTDDPLWAPYLAEAFLAANMRTMKVPPLSRKEEFLRLECPVHVVGAERDISFPGHLLLEKARELFPNLKTAEVLVGARHSPPTTPEFRIRFAGQVRAMLAA